jgi:hypothetical protein
MAPWLGVNKKIRIKMVINCNYFIFMWQWISSLLPLASADPLLLRSDEREVAQKSVSREF